MKEIWKDIEGYENFYQISNYGNVKRKKYVSIDTLGRRKVFQETFVKTYKDNNGYYMVDLNHKRYRVHRLVAMAFVPNPNNYKEINHIDGNKSNEHFKNLEWCSHKYNYEHALKTGLLDSARKKWSESLKKRKIWVKSVSVSSKKVVSFDKNLNKLKEFNSLADAGRYYNIHAQRVWQLCNGIRKFNNGITFRYGE